jgi:hypothetical protein
MVILNKDPLQMEPFELRQLKVEKLLLGGEEYQRGTSLGNAVVDSLKNRSRAV